MWIKSNEIFYGVLLLLGFIIAEAAYEFLEWLLLGGAA